MRVNFIKILFLIATLTFVDIVLKNNVLAQGTAFDPVDAKNLEQLASQYYRDKQWEKAATFYKGLYEMKPQSYYYQYYFYCMQQLEEYQELEKFIKEAIRKNPSTSFSYEVDLGYLYKISGDPKKSAKKYEEIYLALAKNPTQVRFAANEFSMYGETDYAIKSYLKGREMEKNPTAYALDLARLYSNAGDYQSMSDEFINYAIATPTQINTVQNHLQSILSNATDDTIKDALKRNLIRRGQKDPNDPVIQEMLIWIAIQEKDFLLAYEWSVAMDRRLVSDGKALVDLGDMALSNNDYETAFKSYQYVISKGEKSTSYKTAKMKSLEAHYLSVISKPNYKKEDLLSIEADYLNLFGEFGKNQTTIGLIKDYAHLLAFYLDRQSDAIEVLNEAILIPQASSNDVAQCKMELGDIYVLTGEVWDALLLYSQVDKSFKNNPIGYEAKYRNAKLSFYMGEFDWANAQLKILKAATDRLIANDALELSLTISDNMESDSSFTGLTFYARADLFIAQHKYDQALAVLDSIPRLSIIHTLNDDVIMKKAEIALAQYNYTKADTLLRKLVEQFPTSILADNALFQRAEINELKLHNPEVSKECYLKIITEYGGSIYTSESRKQLRILRGEASFDDIKQNFFRGIQPKVIEEHERN